MIESEEKVASPALGSEGWGVVATYRPVHSRHWAWLLPRSGAILLLVLLAALLFRVVWLAKPAGALIFDEAYYVNSAPGAHCAAGHCWRGELSRWQRWSRSTAVMVCSLCCCSRWCVRSGHGAAQTIGHRGTCARPRCSSSAPCRCGLADCGCSTLGS